MFFFSRSFSLSFSFSVRVFTVGWKPYAKMFGKVSGEGKYRRHPHSIYFFVFCFPSSPKTPSHFPLIIFFLDYPINRNLMSVHPFPNPTFSSSLPHPYPIPTPLSLALLTPLPPPWPHPKPHPHPTHTPLPNPLLPPSLLHTWTTDVWVVVQVSLRHLSPIITSKTLIIRSYRGPPQ